MKRVIRAAAFILFTTVFILLIPALNVRAAVKCPICGSSDTFQSGGDLFPCVDSNVEYYCDNCDNYFDTIVKATHGPMTKKVLTNPTCSKDGLMEYTCQWCGGMEAGGHYTKAIPALGHEFEVTGTTEALCTQDGVIISTCTRCGEVMEEIVPAAGHQMVDVSMEPTCTEEGVTGKKCSVCGFAEGEIVPANGHTFGEWITDKKPSVTQEGHRYRECIVCGFTEEETLPRNVLELVLVIIGVLTAVGGTTVAIIRGRKKKKLRELKLPSLSEKIIFSLLNDSKENKDFVSFLKKHRYLDMEFTEETQMEGICEAIADSEPDLILLSLDEDMDTLNEKMTAISEGYEDAVYAVVADKEKAKEYASELKKMVTDEEILAWVPSDEDPDAALTSLILPLYKPELEVDSTVEGIGVVADLLGIPLVSVLTTVYTEGKNIKETIDEGDMDISGTASVIGSIATILGLDTVASVAGLVDDLDTIKEAVDKNAGVNEGADAVDAGLDIVEVISDIID